MVEISLEHGRVHFEVQGWDKLGALKSRLEIPLEHMHSARVDSNPAKDGTDCGFPAVVPASRPAALTILVIERRRPPRP